MNKGQFFEALWWDIRYALRAMRKNPLFSTAVVLTIALGIGCNTAMFSVIHAVLLKPLAYQEPDRVFILSRGATPARYDEMKAAKPVVHGVGRLLRAGRDGAVRHRPTRSFERHAYHRKLPSGSRNLSSERTRFLTGGRRCGRPSGSVDQF